jgi:hypothetical protein
MDYNMIIVGMNGKLICSSEGSIYVYDDDEFAIISRNSDGDLELTTSSELSIYENDIMYDNSPYEPHIIYRLFENVSSYWTW